MTTRKNTLDRRTFLGAGAAAAGALVTTAAGAAAPKPIPLTDAMPVRTLGKTGLKLPILGHGGSAMVDKWREMYGLDALPTHEERVAMVRAAFDKGVRYFDTGRVYDESERIMGEALKDRTEQAYIASKVLVFEADDVRASVEASLEALQMDRIDCMQLHGPVFERLKYEGAMKIYEAMAKLRDEGLFRYIGLTGHNAFDEMHKLIATGGFDTLLIEYGHFKKGFDTRHSETMVEWRDACLAKAHDLDMGIVAMKIMGAWVYGHGAARLVPDFDVDRMARLPGAAIRWVLNDPRVQILNIGVSLPTDVDANIALLAGDTRLTLDDRRLLAEFAARAYLHPTVQSFPVV